MEIIFYTLNHIAMLSLKSCIEYSKITMNIYIIIESELRKIKNIYMFIL